MLQGVAVVIPALNEERTIRAAIESARRAGASEIVVADGGSIDATVAAAIDSGAKAVESEGARGTRLNTGAGATSAGILLFLHADTTLPDDAVDSIERAVAEGAIFGGFRLRFRESSPRLSVAATMINLRCWFTRCPWGDQAQWIRRQDFIATGGFLEDPIMEDYEMAIRMKGRGKVLVLPAKVTTSGRRFLSKGVFLTALINWKVIVMWRLGVSPEKLAAIYRSGFRG